MKKTIIILIVAFMSIGAKAQTTEQLKQILFGRQVVEMGDSVTALENIKDWRPVVIATPDSCYFFVFKDINGAQQAIEFNRIEVRAKNSVGGYGVLYLNKNDLPQGEIKNNRTKLPER